MRGGQRPIRATRFEKIKCADNVSRDEISGTANGSIDMGFRCQVHHMCDAMAPNDIGHGGRVPKINRFKDVFGMERDSLQVLEVPRVGESVEVHEQFNLGSIDDVTNDVRSDEAAAACNE